MPKKGRSTNSKKIKKVILDVEPEPQKDLGELMGWSAKRSSASPEVLIPELPSKKERLANRDKNGPGATRLQRIGKAQKKNKKV